VLLLRRWNPGDDGFDTGNRSGACGEQYPSVDRGAPPWRGDQPDQQRSLGFKPVQLGLGAFRAEMNRTDGGTLGGIIGLEEWNMSDTVTFDAESRALVGKGAARAARRNGRVPAVIYGANKDPEPITIDPAQLRAARMQPGFFATLFDVAVEGGNQKVLCRDLQLHPVTDQPMHADFLRVTDSTRINVEIPVVFENEDEAPGLKGGGVLNVVRHVVEVMCRAGAIPNDIVVDLTGLDIGDSVHIASITLPDGVKPTIDRDFTIATIAAPTVAVVEDDEAEGEDEDGEGAESEGGDDSEGGEDDS